VVVGLRGGSPIGLLWRRRALLGSLVWRDLRTRYAGSAAGLLWAVGNPLLQIAILTTVFSLVLKVRFGSDPNTPFAVTLAWGLFPWIALQEGVARATTALLDNGVLIKRMAFPPEIIVVQPILSALVQQGIALVLLTVLMPFFGVPLRMSVLAAPLPLLLQTTLAIGLGWILAVLHVYVRDTAQLVVAALQAWFYLTPIVYSVDAAPESLRTVLMANPMSGVVATLRSVALGAPMSWGAIAWSGVVAGGALLLGARVMRRARREIADLV
jgi:ABC-type polysaccharide/polyol phosphate export permease